MRPLHLAGCAGGLTLLLCSAIAFGQQQSAARRLTIVVNVGNWMGVELAANTHDKVNWYDADPADETLCTEAHAALELQRYLGKMAGLEQAAGQNVFPIVPDAEVPRTGDLLVVGSLSNNRLTRQFRRELLTDDKAPGNGASGGFQIKTIRHEGRHITFLCGNDRAGTLYAVYDFLERLGVRWLGPGEVNEEVPATLPDPLPEINVVDWPRFQTRGFWAWEDRGNPEFFDWMARNRMNLWTSAQSDIANLKKRCLQLTCGGHQHTERFLNPAAPYSYDHPKFKGDEGKPKDHYATSGESRGDANDDGVLTYAEAHPEWYGWRGGKRITDLRANVNFCTSNRDAVAELTGNLAQDLVGGEWRTADSVNFWTLDGGKWCECERCVALGTPTDRNLLLVHAVRQAIRRAMAEGRLQRNVSVAFLAYADVVDPPTRPLPRDFDYENCVATFFPIVRCYVHRFDDPRCTEYNAPYQKRYWGWAVDPNRHYRGQIFIGEYYNVSGYKNLPILFYRTMPNDIRYFYQTGARHMHYMHAPTGNWGPRALTNYELAKLLWNPDVDAAALLDDYFKKRYGAADLLMRRFYESLERALCNISVIKYQLARNLARSGKDPFTKQHLREDVSHPTENDGPDWSEIVYAVHIARNRIDEVLRSAAKMNLGSKVEARIREDERLFRYAENTILFYDSLIRTQRLLEDGKRNEAAAVFKEAERYGGLLRRDTESTKWASSHANAVNALEASFAAPTVERLRNLLKSK